LEVKKYFIKSWEIIKRNKIIIFISIFIYLVFALIGYFSPNYYLDLQQQTIDGIMSQLEGKGAFFIIGFIISNNIRSAMFGILFGFFLGIYPAFALVANGYLLGAVSSRSDANSFYGIITKIAPHGIFELPAFIIAQSIGISIGFRLLKNRSFNALREDYKNALIVFVCIILPLLIVAGIIEGILYAKTTYGI
jgi:stage II sporulation protein M